MAKVEMIFLMVMVSALAMFGCTEAQTTHQVGDALGWVVPPGGDAAYATWASTQTFRVGDILVFNFTTGAHSVAEVTKESFGTCNTDGPISISTTGPTTITLSSAGEHFYLCTFSGHCSFGQKLAINVSASSGSPAPQPSPATPAPVPVPEPTPSTPAPAPTPSIVDAPTPSPASGGSTVYTVGDGTGWTVPQDGVSTYQTWTSGKSFRVGDVLVFNFVSGAHNVAGVTKASFDSCNISSPLFTTNISPTRITFNTTGEHYYICTYPSHCSLGQKLAINVTSGDGSATPPPSSVATPPSSDLSPPGATTNPESPTSPEGNSSPSSIVLALPITFLAIALTYLY